MFSGTIQSNYVILFKSFSFSLSHLKTKTDIFKKKIKIVRYVSLKY